MRTVPSRTAIFLIRAGAQVGVFSHRLKGQTWSCPLAAPDRVEGWRGQVVLRCVRLQMHRGRRAASQGLRACGGKWISPAERSARLNEEQAASE